MVIFDLEAIPPGNGAAVCDTGSVEQPQRAREVREDVSTALGQNGKSNNLMGQAHIYSDYKMDTQMTVQDYLLKFRKISSLESLEKLFDHLNYSLTDNEEIVNMYRAADHRRAELVSGGKLFDIGQVPKSVWRYVQ
ncbi:hypothetical protein RTE01_35240 [Raoultella terrigena]|uniref:H-NS/StpA-binding protein 2 n=5 Tax=Klebsiella/Raoultella group TaxID=2890311 RepID=A0A485BJQ6_RAOTE|nr:hypothetical protein RTE01_35240 [Raoultella terrigena]VFS73630.1 H-NS/StpA-binding protein 2 [Raoultella terrigena]